MVGRMKCRVSIDVEVYADSPYDAAKLVDGLLINHVTNVVISDTEEVSESPEEPQGEAFAGGFVGSH